MWPLLLEEAADIAGKASTVGDGTILTAVLALTSTIFAALTLNQRSQVDGLQKVIGECRAGRDADVAYERSRTVAAEGKEDKCLDRLAVAVSSSTELSTAVRENATVGTAIVQEVRQHAHRVDAIARTQENLGRDLGDNKKLLDDVKRCCEDLRYQRDGRGAARAERGS